MCSPRSLLAWRCRVAAWRSPCSRARSLSPTYMSAVAPQDWLAMLCRQLQCLLVRPDRVTQPSLGDPDVGQGDRSTERIREAARPLHPRHPSGVDPMRGLEVPARPRGESQERLSCPAEEILVLRSEGSVRPRVPDGRGDVASDLGKARRGRPRSAQPGG